jgi:hypothetical protein
MQLFNVVFSLTSCCYAFRPIYWEYWHLMVEAFRGDRYIAIKFVTRYVPLFVILFASFIPKHLPSFSSFKRTVFYLHAMLLICIFLTEHSTCFLLENWRQMVTSPIYLSAVRSASLPNKLSLFCSSSSPTLRFTQDMLNFSALTSKSIRSN